MPISTIKRHNNEGWKIEEHSFSVVLRCTLSIEVARRAYTAIIGITIKVIKKLGRKQIFYVGNDQMQFLTKQVVPMAGWQPVATLHTLTAAPATPSPYT